MNDTPGYVKNLKKESVVQSVINCLTDAMRNKELKPGDRIPPEPELAASMGVARSSVREAIKILSYLGVLESKRSEGTFVCSGFQESADASSASLRMASRSSVCSRISASFSIRSCRSVSSSGVTRPRCRLSITQSVTFGTYPSTGI